MSQKQVEKWIEYADYINNTSTLTKNQSYAIVGKAFDVSDEEIADELNTTESAVRTQRSRVKASDLSETKRKEVWNTPIPATVFKKIGEIDYFLSDYWETDGSGSGDVQIYESYQDNKREVVVIENYNNVVDELSQESDDQGRRAVMKKVERHLIYDSMEDFLRNSQHSPINLPNRDNELNINKSGELF